MMKMMGCCMAATLAVACGCVGTEAVQPVKSDFAAGGATPVSERMRGHENIEWSISYQFHLTDKQKDLPRVLLVGDSITNYYQEELRELLDGKMTVSYWVSSFCVTSPEYMKILASHLDEADYSVVHFNNGLHSLWTPTEAYVKRLEEAVRLIKEKKPNAKIVWANSTPVNDDYMYKKAKELNAAAAKMFAEKFPEIPTDDLFAVMDPLDRKAYFADKCHPNEAGKKIVAQAVAKCLLAR